MKSFQSLLCNNFFFLFSQLLNENSAQQAFVKTSMGCMSQYIEPRLFAGHTKHDYNMIIDETLGGSIGYHGMIHSFPVCI